MVDARCQIRDLDPQHGVCINDEQGGHKKNNNNKWECSLPKVINLSGTGNKRPIFVTWLQMVTNMGKQKVDSLQEMQRAFAPIETSPAEAQKDPPRLIVARFSESQFAFWVAPCSGSTYF